jgi:hypothetical protein
MWVNVVSQETTTTTGYDFLYCEIHDSSGGLLATPLTLDNRNKASDNNTNGTYLQPATVNLSAYKGQTIQLTFRATNGSVYPTTFRIDDVSIKTGATAGSQLLGNPASRAGPPTPAPWLGS